MKKLTVVMMASIALAKSIWAGTVEGQVPQLYMKQNGDVLIKIDTRNFKTVANGNAHVKDFLAMALTAQTANKSLKIWFNDNDVINSMLIK